MKASILLAATLLTAPAFAQHTSGTIRFEEKLSFELKGEDLPEGMQAFLPKEQKFQKVLYFNADHSLYENNKEMKEEENNEYEQGGIKIRMEHNRPDEKIFVNFKNGEQLAQRDLMGRLFLVKDTPENPKWKLTDRQKKILDMPCQEAWYVQETDTITAWYTSAIPVAGGPKDFAGLPGMILEVNVGNTLSIKAAGIDYNEDATKKIKEPTKGKAVSGKEYDKLAREKQEELQKQYGGKGNVIIKTIRN